MGKKYPTMSSLYIKGHPTRLGYEICGRSLYTIVKPNDGLDMDLFSHLGGVDRYMDSERRLHGGSLHRSSEGSMKTFCVAAMIILTSSKSSKWH